jgi:hypothetical protein
MICLSLNIFTFNFPSVPPRYPSGHTLNNLTCSRTRRIQVLQIHNMVHAARNNKRKRESDHKGHDQLHKSVCWGRAFYISHSAPKLKTKTNTHFMYTKDYYFIFVIYVCMWKRGMSDRHHFVLVVLVLVIVLLIHVEPIIFCIFKRTID